MSESYHTYSCVFHDSTKAAEFLKIIELLQDNDFEEFDACMIRAGLKPAFNRMLYPCVEHTASNENYVECQIQLSGGGTIPKSFIDFIHTFGSLFIQVKSFDEYNSYKEIFYFEGKKSNQKQLSGCLHSLPLDVKLLVAGLAMPEVLPQLIDEFGGYNRKLYGKPLFFYVVNHPDISSKILDAILANADLNLRNELNGDTICHHLARQKDFNNELFLKCVEFG
jgi:hypothetical protein